ncbi:TPA: DUF3644 domain-containing protein [Pasteurella multocida]|nr:DUF3644 domain-containing protein [Pasteurella multocida]
MIIAYTALFHSIFEKKGISYYYKNNDGSFKMIDGQEKAWELSTCMKEYWKGSKQAEAMNLDFLIKLRNRIEHRGLPAIDIMIVGECQAALNNFEVLLSNEFGDEYTLKTNLAISMQLSNVSLQAQINAMKEFQTKSYKVIREFIDGYKRSLDINILSNQNYRMSVFLIPKIGNHFKSSDLAIEFINVDSLSDEELEKYEQAIGFIKGVELPYKLKPSQVVDKVREEFPNFNMHTHTKLWKEYEARPQHHLRSFRGQFSAYVEGYDSYLYSPKWVEFILQILRK